MTYCFDVDKFKATFNISESKTKPTHFTGKCFRVFPYKAKDKDSQVTSVHELIGRYFCQIQECQETTITFDELKNKVVEKVRINPELKTEFEKVLKDLFFDDEKLKPTNLNLMYLQECPKDQKDVADYLSDALGRREQIKAILDECSQRMKTQANVLESLVISLFDPKFADDVKHKPPYFQVVTLFNELFESDLKFILESATRTRESLVDLLHLYYFTYTAQTCLQLNRFMHGNRKQCVPIYFALEWEKTSQGRKCCDEGWKQLHPGIEAIFTHAFVLELLNQTKATHNYDYIGLAEFIEANPNSESEIAEQIRLMADTYRNSIDDCPKMTELSRPDSELMSPEREIEFLFKSVDYQFKYTSRKKPQSNYVSGFIEFCKEQFVQPRGSNGSMLILSESNLILLTKLAIKKAEKLRLNEVFKEFEKRGFYFDAKSKTCVMEYFEKLNLIEKKSDSGDAQYVKRIL